jgi:hypothetical protein
VRQKKGGTYTLQCLDNSLYHREPPRDHLKVIDAKANLQLDDVYYVERILDHQGPASTRRYLIKWLNFPSSDNSWEPVQNLIGCETLLQDYWRARSAMQARSEEQSNSRAGSAEPPVAAPAAAPAAVAAAELANSDSSSSAVVDQSEQQPARHVRRSGRKHIKWRRPDPDN